MNMITEERWNEAQRAETRHWVGAGSSIWTILYELTEHYEELAKALPFYLDGKRGLRAIEIGPGPLAIGFFAIYASDHFEEILGIEPLPIQEISVSDKALEAYVRKVQSRMKMVRGKAEVIPFPDAVFDMASCLNVLDHTHDPDQILKEIGRVVRKGGLFILGVHTRSVLGSIVWGLRRRLHPNDSQFLAHPHSWRRCQVMNKIRAHGWQVLWQSRPPWWWLLIGRTRFQGYILSIG